MLITEGELRSIIRQIIIEEARLDEGKILDAIKNLATGAAKKITSKAMIKILTILMLSGSFGTNTASAEDFKHIANRIVTQMSLPSDQASNILVFMSKLERVVGENPTKEEVKKAGNALASYASQLNIDPKTFYKVLGELIEKTGNESSKSGGSFPHEITDDNVEVKSKGDFYYLYHKAYNLYYKAPKEHLDNYINNGYLHDASDELAGDEVEDRDVGDDEEVRRQQIERYLKILKNNPSEIENELVIVFKAIIDGEYARCSRNYDKKVVITPAYQQKLKNIWDSI